MRSGERSKQPLCRCISSSSGRFHLQTLLAVLLVLSSFSAGESVLNFPRLASEADGLTGLAITNPTDQDALVTVTLYGANGELHTGPGVNPVEIGVAANTQFSILTSELFGAEAAAAPGWFQAVSPVDALTGFFF